MSLALALVILKSYETYAFKLQPPIYRIELVLVGIDNSWYMWLSKLEFTAPLYLPRISFTNVIGVIPR